MHVCKKKVHIHSMNNGSNRAFCLCSLFIYGTVKDKKSCVQGCMHDQEIHFLIQSNIKGKATPDRLTNTLTCSRWHWPRLFSAVSLCLCCYPLTVHHLFLPYPLLLEFLLARGLSDWRMSRCPTSAYFGDSLKSQNRQR